jgi:hypothetical protein
MIKIRDPEEHKKELPLIIVCHDLILIWLLFKFDYH